MEQSCLLLSLLFNIALEFLIREIKQDNEKDIQTEKDKANLSSCEDMNMYI